MTGNAEAKRPSRDIGSAIVSVVWFITYIAALIWVVYGFGGTPWGLTVIVFGLPLLRFVTTVIHEAGHVLGGLVAGWRPS